MSKSDGLMNEETLAAGIERLEKETEELFEKMQHAVTDDTAPPSGLATEYGKRMYTLRMWQNGLEGLLEENEDMPDSVREFLESRRAVVQAELRKGFAATELLGTVNVFSGSKAVVTTIVGMLWADTVAAYISEPSADGSKMDFLLYTVMPTETPQEAFTDLVLRYTQDRFTEHLSHEWLWAEQYPPLESDR